MRHGGIVSILVLLMAACGDSEPVETAPPARETPPPAKAEIPAEFRVRIESLDLAASERPEEQQAAWKAYASLRDAGEDALAAVMKAPDDGRPLVAMLEAWMRSAQRATLGLTPLGDELEFTEEIGTPARRTKMAFKLETSAAGGGTSETIEVNGRGEVTRTTEQNGIVSKDGGALAAGELDAFFALIVENRLWLHHGVRQAGGENEALLTLTQLRDGETIRQIEVWEKEATTFNRSLGKVVAGFRALKK